jgi:hypothetical protein
LAEKFDVHANQITQWKTQLQAIIDWATRKVLAHRVSISRGAEFCREALEEALA